MIRILFILSIYFLNPFISNSQSVPTPKEHFGFNIGDDYQLTNYTQTEAYFKKLAAASDRVKLVSMGLTEEGRTQYMVIVSAPQNIKQLDRYKEISQKLARAENLTDAQARSLATEGKAIVWIDGGLHSTETVGTHQLIETVYQFVSRSDAENIRILENAIILFVHANPDGHELVSNWYMKDTDVKKRNMNIPRLYEKYIGHDNNRDFLMMNMKESQNISRQQYLEWIPQIIYNHHQQGPLGTIVAGPPYRDPFNYVYDPLLMTSIDAVGAAMHSRLNRENKPGYTQRNGHQFSTWWNGGLRTTAYYHNIIGLLTEMVGNPTPMKIPLVPNRLIPDGGTPNPVTPQEWHYRQSIDYSLSLNYAVLNFAVNQKEDLLFGIYQMGKNSIERGSRDNWTLSPKKIDSILKAFKKNDPVNTAASWNAGDTIASKYFNLVLKDSNLRDPRGFIIPADQTDFPTAVKFVNTLIRSGLTVHKANADFMVRGKKYPAGSYVVKTAQAFRPHVLDMFEPQDHPNDFAYPGGPPVRPYDAAGWTIAYSMGIVFDRILEDFTGPFERIPYGELQSYKASVAKTAGGYLLSPQVNNSFIVVNDLLQAGIDVYRVEKASASITPGSFFIPSSVRAKEMIEKSAIANSADVSTITKPASGLKKLTPLRIGLWDGYGGSMPSGWVRWLMEQYHFPFQVVYPKEINAGDLNKKYDVLVFVTGAIPSPGSNAITSRIKPEDVPEEFRNRMGRISADTSIPQLKRFLESGGQIVTIGSSTNLAYHLKLPVRNALTELNTANVERPLAGEKYYIPGSILRVKVDSAHPAAWGMKSETDVYFDASPVFKFTPDAIVKGEIKPLAWFGSEKTLRSGWAWGQAYLKDGVAAFTAPVGKGNLYAFGPEITFRGQTHGTFKLLFNQLYKMQ